MTPRPEGLLAKILAIHAALVDIPHAFGGAIALAYYAEPRATIDIDLNVFASPSDPAEVLDALAALGVARPDGTLSRIARDGQIRLRWDETPVDLFFAYDRFHDAARDAAQEVPLASTTIPILSVEHLIVCKAAFDRPKDWLDIISILTKGTSPDVAECLRWLGRIVGDTDARYDRLAATLTGR